MVAGGGGGVDWIDKGGAGGGLEGFESINGSATGGNQTSGGNGYYKGSFGKGGGITDHITTSGGNTDNILIQEEVGVVIMVEDQVLTHGIMEEVVDHLSYQDMMDVML